MGSAMAIWLISPNPGTSQPWACEVKGRGFGGAVQLRVLAADNKWYPQPHVTITTMGDLVEFRGTAYLGWEDNPQTDEYTIAAGIGGEWSNIVTDSLPSDILWVTTTVTRI